MSKEMGRLRRKMSFHDAALKDLAKGIGRDQTEPL